MKKNLLIFLIIIFGFLCFFLGGNINKDIPEDYFVKEGYSFYMPETWVYDESLGMPTIINSEEERKAEDNFRSYIVFLEDDLNNRSSEQFYESVKSSMKNSLGSIDYFEEYDSGNIHIVKGEAESEGKKYSIYTAFIKGISNNYWVLTLNTDEVGLEDADNVFNKVVESFKVR